VTRKSAAHHLLATAKIKKKLTKIFELIAPVYELSTPSSLSLVESSFVEQHGSNVLGYNTRHGGVHDNIIGGTTVIGGDIMPGHTSKVVRGGNIVYEG